MTDDIEQAASEAPSVDPVQESAQPEADAGEQETTPVSPRPKPDEPYAVRIRMKFTKQGPTRFLSHLDLLKCVERAIRRSGIPVAYTEGFHPRIRISFGPALALGHASCSEWMDVDMAEIVDPSTIQARLNLALPGGLEIVAARVLAGPARALQAEVRMAVYRVLLDSPGGWTALDLTERIAALLAQQEIALKKKNKTVNLRAFIDELQVAQTSPCALDMRLTLGPEGSVRPEDVLGVLAPHGELTATFVERVALLTTRDGAWHEP